MLAIVAYNSEIRRTIASAKNVGLAEEENEKKKTNRQIIDQFWLRNRITLASAEKNTPSIRQRSKCKSNFIADELLLVVFVNEFMAKL